MKTLFASMFVYSYLYNGVQFCLESEHTSFCIYYWPRLLTICACSHILFSYHLQCIICRRKGYVPSNYVKPVTVKMEAEEWFFSSLSRARAENILKEEV